VNQKIFLACWFIFIILILLSGIKVIFNLLLLFFPGLRYFLLRSQASTLPTTELSRVHRQCSYGDHTLLMFIARNLDASQFETLLTLASDRLSLRHGLNEDYPALVIPSHIKKASEGENGGFEGFQNVRSRKTQEISLAYNFGKPAPAF
jgi:hypothetical protein